MWVFFFVLEKIGPNKPLSHVEIEKPKSNILSWCCRETETRKLKSAPISKKKEGIFIKERGTILWIWRPNRQALSLAEARDKICRAIQYGSKFLSNGQPGTAQNVDKSTSLARKVFRLFKFVNDLHGLISPVPQGTPLPLVLLGKSKNALLSTFLFLDQIVWLGRTGIHKNKERADLIGRISLFCWMGSSICSTLVELGELGRLSASMKKLEKNLKNSDKYKNEQYRAKLEKSSDRTLALVKAGMDIVVAAGLLQLAPKKVTPRVTGAFGFVSSLISCYQLLPAPAKSKTEREA